MAENLPTLKIQLRTIIFGTDTPAGKNFDIALLVCILSSVLVVILESVQEINTEYHYLLIPLEWIFTIVFTIEYILRIYCTTNRLRYITSFFGIIDLLSILPNYIALFYSPAHYSTLFRLLRLLRVFRILKLVRYIRDAHLLTESLYLARRRILLFFAAVMIIVTIFGGVMYVIEGPDNGFENIPESIYWAIVTVTTVGYGDISPKTPFGQMISSLAMLLGYAIIAIPTGIISAQMIDQSKKSLRRKTCSHCNKVGLDDDSSYCKYCGHKSD